MAPSIINYVGMPIQNFASFGFLKNGIFHIEHWDIFLIIAPNNEFLGAIEPPHFCVLFRP